MKRIIALFFAFVLVIASSLSVFAEKGRVTYRENAGDFVFEPGSMYSPTYLFPEIKDVMPGDTLTQKITVKNNADNKVKVKIYMRALGAHEDSKKFLSKLNLTVQKSSDNDMAYMFDAAANKKAQLKDWVCLGTLYSGGKVNFDVVLDVPTSLDNEFQNSIGYLDWEFMVKEYPIEKGDPVATETGENFNLALWITVLLCSLSIMIILFVWRKRDKKSN